MRFFRHSFAGGVALLAVAVSGLTAVAFSQDAPSADNPISAAEIYVTLDHRSADHMDPADAAVVQARQGQIAAEAAVFGYDLRAGEWTYDQALCPEIPDYLVLHYRNQSRGGAASVLTVLVPRGEGHILAVPVRYRNATPYESAAAASRTIAAFNRVVPAEIAREAMNPKADWLKLGMCYAAVAGVEPTVPMRTGHDLDLLNGPRPTLQISVAGHANLLRFTDRDTPSHFAVWTIALDNGGRVTSADAVPHAISVPGVVPAAAPPEEHIIPSGPPPTIRMIPAAPAPTETPVPTN